MLRKSALYFFLGITTFFYLHAQQSGNFVTVKGKVINKKDSSALPAVTVYFEKLPYYDDMGMTKSASDGAFEFSMADGVNYNFRIEGVSGYESFEEQILITADSEGLAQLLLQVQPEELEELIRLDNLNFNRGSATILPSSYQSLNEFINYINQRPEVLIQLEGHTDPAGNPEANMRLSQARVESVAEYLSSNGLKKNRITTKAFGGTQPLSTETTDEAKRLNRRVEVRLIRQGS
jgi:OOP family OmpA-OmpF porin